MGWVLSQKCFRIVVEGGCRSAGTSSDSLRQQWSNRHMSGASQAKPPSIRATFNDGNCSNTPSQTKLMTWA